jgi:hypothetical protein
MDPLIALGSSLPLPLRQPGTAETRGVESGVYPPASSSTESNPAQAAFDSLQRDDPATQQQKTLHFISHVNAECFISLLQITDQKPDDYRARAEYKRFYRHLRQTLETPLPTPEPYPPYPPDRHPEILR